MRRRPADTKPANDADLFRDTVGPVQPVSSRRLPLAGRGPAPKARFARADRQAVLRESLEPPAVAEGLETGEELHFRRDHVPPKVLRDLRQGRYRVQDELDLHGMTAVQARAALLGFLGTARTRSLSCVRIIHGKGRRSGPAGPVLKGSVNGWLRRWEPVLAFCSAPQRDGGTGAVYVLLTR